MNMKTLNGNDITVGMWVRPMRARYDWRVSRVSDAGFVYLERYSDTKGWLFSHKSAAAVARGELRTYTD